MNSKKEFEVKRAKIVANLSILNQAKKLELTPLEMQASLKWELLKKEVHSEPYLNLYNELQHNFKKFKDTKLYQQIRKLPKGVLQHAHLPATLSFQDFLSVMTHDERILYSTQDKELRVARAGELIDLKKFVSFKKYRETHGNEVVDAEMESLIIMNDKELRNRNSKTVFDAFTSRFTKMWSAFTYEPVLREFIRKCVQELKADNIMGVELRNVNGFFTKTDLSVGTFDEELRFMNQIKQEMQQDDFYLDFIHTGMKQQDKDPLSVKSGLEIAMYAQTVPEFKETFCGIDMVDYEDNFLLFEMKDQLLDIKEKHPTINFIFHAGESTQKNNLNIIDAILMDCKRIGHGLAIAYHPVLMERLIEHNICIEINLVSNFMLGYMRDPFWHPLRMLINSGVNVALSSDDCLFWDVSPLSMDFFAATVYCDLSLGEIKWLIGNSIKFSYMSEARKALLQKDFLKRWDMWAQELVHLSC